MALARKTREDESGVLSKPIFFFRGPNFFTKNYIQKGEGGRAILNLGFWGS